VRFITRVHLCSCYLDSLSPWADESTNIRRACALRANTLQNSMHPSCMRYAEGLFAPSGTFHPIGSMYFVPSVLNEEFSLFAICGMRVGARLASHKQAR
jgi:hypothetical protein